VNDQKTWRLDRPHLEPEPATPDPWQCGYEAGLACVERWRRRQWVDFRSGVVVGFVSGIVAALSAVSLLV
jgi:hypothetical protein